MKVLLIDDNKKITDMLETYLKLKGYEITISNSGRNGLQLIENGNYDVVILDIAMPEFSGFDVIDALVKDKKMEGNKIIVLTAAPLTHDETTSLVDKGVMSILSKPANLKMLLDLLMK